MRKRGQRTRSYRRTFNACAVVAACALILTTFTGFLARPRPVSAATDFAATVFRYQWEIAEEPSPNFFGPLANASPGLQEPYREAAGGLRVVQYFDKTRMELTGPNTVTNGLLTFEMKTGKMQVGDNAYESRPAATITLAGDANQPGPTYADLFKLPEVSPTTSGAALTTTFTNGGFSQSSAPGDPALALVQYIANPNGKYGQYVPKAFWDYLNAMPLSWQSIMGYPMTPAFGAQIIVNGAPRQVYMQAFERRVLTYTPSNPAPYMVEFGNIGQHYYKWRYNASVVPTQPATPTPRPAPPPQPAAPRAPQPAPQPAPAPEPIVVGPGR